MTGGSIQSDPVIVPTVVGFAGADGRVTLEVNADAVFDALRATEYGGLPPVRVEADVSIHATHLGIGRTLPPTLGIGPAAEIDAPLAMDFAKTIVGHVTQSTARIWFTRHGSLGAGDQYVCRIHRLSSTAVGGVGRPIGDPVDLPVVFDATRANTAVVDVNDLAAGAFYQVSLRLTPIGAAPVTLSYGRLRTERADAGRIRFAFGSCHRPTEGGALERWEALAGDDDFDFALLIGDQIYEYGLDGVADTWLARYNQRYQTYWTPKALRDVVGTRPTYMMWDDHEIRDDWGSFQTAADPENATRFVQAQLACETFQLAHGVRGVGSGQFDYSFRKGPAAFYVLDTRSFRGTDPEFPILGFEQFTRFRNWVDEEVRDADIAFVIVSGPPALMPVAQVEAFVDEFESDVGSVEGAAAGAGIGAAIGGPLGLVAGAFIGYYVGGEIGKDIDFPPIHDRVRSAREEYDLDDQWTITKNQPDLRRVLVELGRLARGEQRPADEPGLPRATFILSGDIHAGAIHTITDTSDPPPSLPIIQLTSSPISHPPPDDEMFARIVGHIQDDLGYTGFESLILGEIGSPASFHLDEPDRRFRADLRAGGPLMERNFGLVSFERLGPARYRFDLGIEGTTGNLRWSFEVDLGLPSPGFIDLSPPAFQPPVSAPRGKPPRRWSRRRRGPDQR